MARHQGGKDGDRDEVAEHDLLGPRQRHAGHRQRQDDEIAHNERRTCPPEVARTRQAEQPERPGGEDQDQVRPDDLREQDPAEQETEDHQRQAGDDQDYQIRQRGLSSLPTRMLVGLSGLARSIS